MVEVGEIHATVHLQRIIVVGVELIVLQREMAAHDTHGVVAETESHAVGFAHQIATVEIHLPVYLRLAQLALHGEVAVGISLEADDLIGNEAVEQ